MLGGQEDYSAKSTQNGSKREGLESSSAHVTAAVWMDTQGLTRVWATAMKSGGQSEEPGQQLGTWVRPERHACHTAL